MIPTIIVTLNLTFRVSSQTIYQTYLCQWTTWVTCRINWNHQLLLSLQQFRNHLYKLLQWHFHSPLLYKYHNNPPIKCSSNHHYNYNKTLHYNYNHSLLFQCKINQTCKSINNLQFNCLNNNSNNSNNNHHHTKFNSPLVFNYTNNTLKYNYNSFNNNNNNSNNL